MLENIREGVKKPWVKVVIFAIVISFVFAGYFSSAFFLGDPNAVVIVNGESISKDEFQRSYGNKKARQADFYKAMVKTEEDERNFQESVIQDLITSKVRELAIRDLGIRLSTSALRDAIQTDPNYQLDGKYSSALVDQTLVNLRWSRDKFKKAYENQETNAQFVTGVYDSGFALASEAKTDYAIGSQTRSGRALAINVARFKESIEVTDEEIQQDYQENQENFRVEEKVSVEYLELTINELLEKQNPTEEQISEYYQNNIEQYRSEEERQISHILILSNDDDDAASAKANAIKARLDSGEDFVEIAKLESDDIPTRETGGDLGVVYAGVLDPAIEAAAFELAKVGDISAPVKSGFGYHLIRLTNLQPGSAQPLDQVKDELVAQLKKSQAEVEFITLSQKLGSAVFEVSDSLASAAAITGLEIKTSSMFGISNGEGLFANPDLRNAAFSSDVKEAQLNSAPIELSDNHLVVLRINEHKPSEIQPIESVKDRIVNGLKQKKAKKQAEELAQTILDKIKAKDSVDEIIAANKLNWIDLDKIERNNASLSSSVNQEFFKMPKPEENAVNLKKVEDQQGFTILMLNQVVAGDWDVAVEQRKKQQTQYINSLVSNAEFSALINDLRNNADIKRNQSDLIQ